MAVAIRCSLATAIALGAKPVNPLNFPNGPPTGNAILLASNALYLWKLVAEDEVDLNPRVGKNA